MKGAHEMRISVLIGLIILLLFIYGVCAKTPDYPPFYVEKIFAVPDLIQTDKRAHFPGGGSEYCCYVAIANSLMWLSSNGYPGLVQRTGSAFDDEVALVNVLASQAYMNPSPGEGGTIDIIRGLSRYIQDRGYSIDRLEYQGWRQHPPEIHVEQSVPELPWIKQHILGKGCVWLNVGWYKYDPSRQEYRRIAGHWVTVVGYGKDERGAIDPRILIVHDPSPRAGRYGINEYAHVRTIEAGVLTGDYMGLPRCAIGYCALGGGMHIKQDANTAIVDDALALTLASGPRGNAGAGNIGANKPVAPGVSQSSVLRDEPKNGPPPKRNLSQAERLQNFEILADAIDKRYSFFILKNIHWPEITARYRAKVATTVTDDDFYLLLYWYVRELKDCHSWLCNYKDVPRLGDFSPPVHTRLIEGKCVVTEVEEGSEARAKGISRGCVVLGVDGLTVEKRVEQIRPLLHMFSSERGFREEAYRRVLDGKRGTDVAVDFLNAAGSKATATLQRTRSQEEQIIKPGFPVTKGKFIWYGVDPSGCGYIQILSFDGRMEIADEFDAALETMRNAPGLIIDVRDNPGGFGTAQQRIIGRFITSTMKVAKSYVRNGSGHGDFEEIDAHFGPTGNWQYTRPVALLINAVTGSACDQFTCYFKSTGRPIIIGTTTHGNLSGTGVYAQLPCNLVVRISNGYECDATGRIIEVNGTEPQIKVEPTIRDIMNGTDPVIERAIKECMTPARQRTDSR